MNIKKIIRNILKVIYIFPINNNKIFLMNFNGTAIGLDAKAVYQYASENKLNYKFVWGVTKGFKNRKIENIKFVKLKSLQGIYEMLTSRVLIYNINAPMYIPFRKCQILINTWHGLGIKASGRYVDGFSKEQFNLTTCFLSHAKKYTEVAIRDSFQYEGEVLCSGVPRNDIFFNINKVKDLKRKVKKIYNINESDKILLYAPTFRNDFKYGDIKIDLNKVKDVLEKRKNEKWVIMFRAHPMIKENIKCKNVIDVSDYEDIQEILCATDILITDYSSISWDISLMYKPVFIFAPDINEYINKRGLNDIYKLFPYSISLNNKELENQILEFDYEAYKKNLDEYFINIGNYEKGNSCQILFEYINNKINKKGGSII